MDKLHYAALRTLQCYVFSMLAYIVVGQLYRKFHDTRSELPPQQCDVSSEFSQNSEVNII